MKTVEGVTKAVINGFKPFLKEVGPRGVSEDDVDHLLKIPIRRISLYDINKARSEMQEIQARVKEINGHLKNITAYALSFLDGVIAKIKANPELGKGERKTKVGAFDKVDVKELVKNDLELKYDREKGYLGTAVNGETVIELSPFDRILILRQNAAWSVTDIPDKAFVGAGAWWIGIANKEALSQIIFTIIYKDPKNGYPCIKRCVIEGWIMNKDYSLVPEGATVLHIDTREKVTITVKYVPKPRLKVLAETFKANDYIIRGLKANGVRLSNKEAAKVEVKA
jgi:topoisomerase-4 subunit A